jgi:hypothetical protein
MNRLGLKTLVAGWLDDLNYGYFTESQVETWLNNAQREVQKRLIKTGQNFYTKYVQTTLVVNQSDYVLPSNFKNLNRLELVMSGTPPNESKVPLGPITTGQQDLVSSGTGTPRFYRYRRNRLILTPTPDTPLVLRMEYTYLVSDMTLDTDTPDVPDSYDELIALLAAQDGFIKDDRAAPLLVKKIDEYQKQLDSDANERSKDGPRQVVETGNNNDSGFFW